MLTSEFYRPWQSDPPCFLALFQDYERGWQCSNTLAETEGRSQRDTHRVPLSKTGKKEVWFWFPLKFLRREGKKIEEPSTPFAGKREARQLQSWMWDIGFPRGQKKEHALAPAESLTLITSLAQRHRVTCILNLSSMAFGKGVDLAGGSPGSGIFV